MRVDRFEQVGGGLRIWARAHAPEVKRLVAAGQWRTGDPEILVVFDAGYDTARLADQLPNLPVDLLGRIRSDRVLRLPARPRQPGEIGRPAKRGDEFRLAHPLT